MAKQSKTATRERIEDEHPEDAATETHETQSLPMPATEGGLPFQTAADPNAEATALDPGGDIATDFRTQVIGREIVITRWGLAPSSEQYANANPYGVFAVLGFYFSDDPERKGRFATTGATRIVETVHKALTEKNVTLPVKTTAITFRTRGGTEGQRFVRPGETIR